MIYIWKRRSAGKRFTREQMRDDNVHHHSRDNAEHDPVCNTADRVNRGTVSELRRGTNNGTASLVATVDGHGKG